ncbi:MAG: hypothetical protein ABSG68_02180 [Thermoguttaceae bacterium]
MLAVVGVLACSNSAAAAGPYVWPPAAFWGGYVPGADPHQSPPYYALYPPVYYGRAVARDYGSSPYAMPPGAVGDASSEGFSSHVAPGPLRIINPYVSQSAERGVAMQVKVVVPKPLVIYPCTAMDL